MNEFKTSAACMCVCECVYVRARRLIEGKAHLVLCMLVHAKGDRLQPKDACMHAYTCSSCSFLQKRMWFMNFRGCTKFRLQALFSTLQVYHLVMGRNMNESITIKLQIGTSMTFNWSWSNIYITYFFLWKTFLEVRPLTSQLQKYISLRRSTLMDYCIYSRVNIVCGRTQEHQTLWCQQKKMKYKSVLQWRKETTKYYEACIVPREWKQSGWRM